MTPDQFRAMLRAKGYSDQTVRSYGYVGRYIHESGESPAAWWEQWANPDRPRSSLVTYHRGACLYREFLIDLFGVGAAGPQIPDIPRTWGRKSIPHPPVPEIQFEAYLEALGRLDGSGPTKDPAVRLLRAAPYLGMRHNALRTLRVDQLENRPDPHGKPYPGIFIPATQAKGGRERWVPLVGEAGINPLDAVNGWIFANPATGKPLSATSVYRWLDKLRNELGEWADKMTVHSLRHTYASRLLRKGVSVRHIQFLLGHADISTTQRYLHVTETDVVEAVAGAFST